MKYNFIYNVISLLYNNNHKNKMDLTFPNSVLAELS